MFRPELQRNICFFSSLFILLALGACDAVEPHPTNSPTTALLSQPPTTVLTASPTLPGTILSPVITPALTPTFRSNTNIGTTPATRCATVALDYAQVPLTDRIKNTNQIIVGQVIRMDPPAWNTYDGNPPANPCLTKEYFQPEHEQLTPIQVLVKESFKGNLPVGMVLNLNLKGLPGTQPGIIPAPFIVSQGETVIWFLNDARGIGWPLVNDPTLYTGIAEVYKKQGNFGWYGRYTSGTFADLAELIRLINPPKKDSFSDK